MAERWLQLPSSVRDGGYGWPWGAASVCDRHVPVMWFTYGQKKHSDPWATVRVHWMRGRALSKSNQPLHGEDCWQCRTEGLFTLQHGRNGNTGPWVEQAGLSTLSCRWSRAKEVSSSYEVIHVWLHVHAGAQLLWVWFQLQAQTGLVRLAHNLLHYTPPPPSPSKLSERIFCIIFQTCHLSAGLCASPFVTNTTRRPWRALFGSLWPRTVRLRVRRLMTFETAGQRTYLWPCEGARTPPHPRSLGVLRTHTSPVWRP